MRTSDILRASKRLAALCLLACFGLPAAAGAQTTDRTDAGAPTQTPASPVSAARESELECSGFIEHRPPKTRMEIVGGEEEQEQNTYAEGDYVYVNAGSQDGVRAGQEFTIIRPRGRFKSSFSRKDGTLGMYTQELGRLRVVSVKPNVSVGLLTRTCDNILLGDLLRPAPERPTPVVAGQSPFDRFAEPSGKQQGRIVLARDGREMVSRDHVVFIDLGEEDNVRPGDRLTVFRPIGRGNITRLKNEEITPNRSRGFESNVFRGGRYSIKAQRVKDPVKGNNSTVTTPNVKDRRPALPRKVVGELVVISVEARTAVAVVTRTAQEIHTGDRVEVQ